MTDLLRHSIETFCDILNRNRQHVYELGQNTPGRDPDSFVADWAQATWEMTVEAAATASQGHLVYLEPYGEGADCNDVGSRVWHPGVSSTHSVNIVPRQGSLFLDALTGSSFLSPDGGVPLDQFVHPAKDGWYRTEPPFDHVLIYLREAEKVVALGELDFLLTPVPQARCP